MVYSKGDFMFNKRCSVFSILIVLSILLLTGCSKSDSKSSTEPQNNDPVISSITLSPSSIPASGLVAVTVTATDQDGGTVLSYNFSPDDGTITGAGVSRIWIAPSTEGSHTISITVSDEDGGETTDSGTLTVTAPVTQITGIAQLEDGVTGDLSNSVVRLFDSRQNFNIFNWIQKIDALSVHGYAYFTFTNISPGSYYVEIIKDNNNNLLEINTGDYWGVHGSAEHFMTPELIEIQISEGQTIMCNIIMYEM